MSIKNYKITVGVVEFFNNEVRQAILGQGRDLHAVLAEGRGIRCISGKHTHFWEFSQKNIHAQFDALYKVGVRHLARQSLEQEGSSLEGRLTPELGARGVAKKVGGLAAMGLGAFVGWGLGYIFYTKPMANLILHEKGHAWAEQLVYHNTEPTTQTNAQYWLEHGDFKSYFAGRREGGSGNWEGLGIKKDPSQPITLTDWGKTLTPNQRKLFIKGGGLGIELIFNTLLAALGLVAIKRKKRVLGASMLGFAVISHSAAHSYIRRYYTPGQSPGGDPPLISHYLSKELHVSQAQAFHILDVGYILFPVMVLGALSLILLNAPPDIPEEEVLMRMLSESDPELEEHLQLATMLKEIELDFYRDKLEVEALGNTPAARRKKKLIAGKMLKELKEKVHKNRKTRRFFKRIEKAMQKELKGALAARLPKTYRIRIIAGVCALFAYALITVTRNVLYKAQPLLSWLCGIFIALQGICAIIDVIHMVAAFRNEQLTQYAKGLSVLRTVISITAAVLVSIALLNPVFYPLFLPILITAAVLGLVIAVLQHREMKRLSTFYQQIAETPLWDQMLADAEEHLDEGEALFDQRKGESKEEFRLRLAEAAQAFSWLEAQAEAASKNRLSPMQSEAAEALLARYRALKKSVPGLHRHLFIARHVTSRFVGLRGEKRDGLLRPVIVE